MKEAKKEIKKEKKEESSSEEEDSKPLKTRSKRAKDGDSSDAGSVRNQNLILQYMYIRTEYYEDNTEEHGYHINSVVKQIFPFQNIQEVKICLARQI